jgi:hypothetical protein
MSACVLLLLLFAAGCSSELPATDDKSPPAQDIGKSFDAAQTGTVTGSVTWKGAIPNPPGFLLCIPKEDGTGHVYKESENPNKPRVNPTTRAVAGAVVFLRDIELTKSRSWDLPPVRVEMKEGQISVVQGERRSRVGFVRRGEAVTAVSTEPVYHVLRARGDAFFSIALPEPNRPTTRRLSKPGRVELSSGTGLYWARADLFVTDHPYFTVTDSRGYFSFENVPAGNVQLVVWLPGWDAASQERDPDSTAITRMTYSPPLEQTRSVVVSVNGTAEASFTVP